MIDSDEMEAILRMKKSLISNPFHSWLWKPSTSEIEILYQVPIYFEDRGIRCKALLDIVVINHALRTITPIDLKTTGRSVYQFKSSLLKFSYFLQAAHYQCAIRTYLERPELASSPVLDSLDLDSSYQLENMRFLVVPSDSSEPVEMFIMSDDDLYKSRYGGFINGRSVQGTAELIDAFKWHLQNDEWEYSVRYLKSKGETQINMFDK